MDRDDRFWGTTGEIDGPLDLTAVQADDALLDVLGAMEPDALDGDRELTEVLLAWRREVDEDPYPELVDTDHAIRLITAARSPAGRGPGWHRFLGPVAVAAAVMVVAFSGVSLAAKSAVPGDRLFGLTRVLYSEQAMSAEAVDSAEQSLARADTALTSGTPQEAEQALDEVGAQLPLVTDEARRAELQALLDELRSRLDAQGQPVRPSTPAPTTTPGPSDTSAPVAPPVPDTTDPQVLDSVDDSPQPDPTTSDPETSTPPDPSGENGSSAPGGSDPNGGDPGSRTTPGDTGSAPANSPSSTG